ncbi:fibronectin type III domain-containing protein [Pseudomonas vancouverensis]|uniref:fibronectin type III domain-containing protein n=1 Tax=Pseudomonas vancouverensis TaxID=95300 RepID=UPI003CFE0A4C
MKQEPVNNEPTSETTASDDISPKINYSRWMTDMATEIAHLKLHQLAIPGAHNSGVDRSGKFDIGTHFAACQQDTFSKQLAAGARYLDLRLVDDSYKKVTGRLGTNWKFVEVFHFKHGVVSVGRTLENLVDAVKSFATANPGEIIFIDFHHYNRGKNYAYNSLERCLPKFSSIKDRLIPRSASDLSIGEIRQKHPGCNIILCMAHDYPVPVPPGPNQPAPPDRWPSNTVRRDQIWDPLRHEWNPEDSSLEGITSLVIESMKSPPEKNYWALSAAVTEKSAPAHLPANSPVRTEVFKPGFQNVNVLMVDFIELEATRTSVTDRCIALNKLRSADKTAPTAPSNLFVEAFDKGTGNGLFPNTLKFTWNVSTDNLGVRRYQIFQDGNLLATTYKNFHEHKNFGLRNYSFQVKSLDLLNNTSAPSNTFNLIQDDIPPTMPYDLQVFFTKDNVALTWEHSWDLAGVEGYDVFINEAYLRFVPYGGHHVGTAELGNLNFNKAYEIKVRGKDINGFYSEFLTGTIYPRPTLINAQHFVTGFDEQTKKYTVKIEWKIDAIPIAHVNYRGTVNNLPVNPAPSADGGPAFTLEAYEGDIIEHSCEVQFYGIPSLSTFTPYNFNFKPTTPVKISNLKVTNRTPSGTSISWTASPSTDITNYAISINEAPPILVSKSTTSYTFEQLPVNESFEIEVWAINGLEVPSIAESITTEAIPDQPPQSPTNFRYRKQGAIWIFDWTPPQAPVNRYRVTLHNLSTGQKEDSFHDSPTGEFRLTSGRSYVAKVVAENAAGESPPLTSQSFEA